MDFNISLTEEQLNVVLRHLDAGPHREVRPLIDTIIAQAQQQAAKIQAPVEPPDAPDMAEGGTD